MVGMLGRIPVGNRISMASDHEGHASNVTPSFDDRVFRFIEGEGSFDSVGSGSTAAYEFDDEEEPNENLVERLAYWELQHQLLHNKLNGVRNQTSDKRALRESKSEGITCSCRRPANTGCRNCLIEEVSGRLQKAGFDSAICRSKWRSSADIPSGEHTFLAGEHSYIDVVQKSSTKQMEVRVVIELKFRAEFEMARASEEYNTMIERLPEFFVGKAERLRSLIKILCSASKKCMKEKNMHMGPWRKHKYMQAKRFGTCERVLPEPAPTKLLSSHRRLVKPKASLLTFDLTDRIPGSLQQFTAIEVV